MSAINKLLAVANKLEQKLEITAAKKSKKSDGKSKASKRKEDAEKKKSKESKKSKKTSKSAFVNKMIDKYGQFQGPGANEQIGHAPAERQVVHSSHYAVYSTQPNTEPLGYVDSTSELDAANQAAQKFFKCNAAKMVGENVWRCENGWIFLLMPASTASFVDRMVSKYAQGLPPDSVDTSKVEFTGGKDPHPAAPPNPDKLKPNQSQGSLKGSLFQADPALANIVADIVYGSAPGTVDVYFKPGQATQANYNAVLAALGKVGVAAKLHVAG